MLDSIENTGAGRKLNFRHRGKIVNRSQKAGKIFKKFFSQILDIW